jgi:hypothetical protein
MGSMISLITSKLCHESSESNTEVDLNCCSTITVVDSEAGAPLHEHTPGGGSSSRRNRGIKNNKVVFFQEDIEDCHLPIPKRTPKTL